MKALYYLAAVGLAASAQAQFSASSGTGGGIPLPPSTGGIGGWDPAGLDYDLTQAEAPDTVTIMVPVAVNCIDSIEIDGLEHTWMGDTMAVLRDPNGMGHLIWIRPNMGQNATCCGNGGNILPGLHTFVEAGTDPNSQGPLPLVGDAPPEFGTSPFPPVTQQAP